jgi:hypothetical protein
MISRKDIIAAEFFQRYVNMTEEPNVVKSITKNSRKFLKLIESIPKKKIDFAYAEGKWTIKELFQHIMDAERVFVYRALTFSRRDGTPLPGFDENSWTSHSGASKRDWKDLCKEFKALRSATEYLFESFTDEQLLATGTASGHPINVLALGFIISGHVEHHIKMIKERYL